MLTRLRSFGVKLREAMREPRRGLRAWRKRLANHQAIEVRRHFDALLAAKSFPEAAALVAAKWLTKRSKSLMKKFHHSLAGNDLGRNLFRA